MKAAELKEILMLLKEFEVTDYKDGELMLHRDPVKPLVERKSSKLPLNNFPESQYHSALQTPDITPEELAVLGFAGVAPTKKS